VKDKMKALAESQRTLEESMKEHPQEIAAEEGAG